MGYFSISVNDFNLVDGVNGRGETTMNAKDLIVDHHAQGEKIEHVGEIVPNIGIAILSCALRVEAIGLGDAPGFMIAANEMDALRVS